VYLFALLFILFLFLGVKHQVGYLLTTVGHGMMADGPVGLGSGGLVS